MHSIYLLRHCAYDNPRNILPGRLPVPLSESGKLHAQRLQEFFATKNISHIYSSAVLRCQQTSEIIANDTVPISNDQRILETLSAYQGYWGENQHADGYHFFSHIDELGGETLAMLQKRMAEFWDEVILSTTENTILCSHGDPLQVLYSYIQNIPLVDDNAPEDTIPGWLEKGEFFEVVVENGEVTAVKEKVAV
ncbi:phosphoglycerate mutase family protein [Candidatus Woesebacteria bacterium]|nr:phosphoglycerate mutase family protein [Candidatus Woesebacteria bacterium]MCD8507127.1 phosphoglycerate mutase family protein [Candidatus Woesebacteria bacterium]MCD8526900.1 phosphoglycerate mutase family protein [Candidatus Woesebacteria bacterium]MCD8546050.1 phosphoglycerate mutase family protein [Candidatus Woesebacteria bacterium]